MIEALREIRLSAQGNVVGIDNAEADSFTAALHLLASSIFEKKVPK